MPAGASGRIVVDIDPATKRLIYSALKRRGLTMREWLLAMSLVDLGVPQDSDRAANPSAPACTTITNLQGQAQ